jgi:archaellum component FlaD/FlaE
MPINVRTGSACTVPYQHNTRHKLNVYAAHSSGALSEAVEQQLLEFARALRKHSQSGRSVKIA